MSMSRLYAFPRQTRHYILLIAGVALSGYFAYHTFLGERSIEHQQKLSVIAAQKEQKLASVLSEREKLERDVKMLRPETLSLDMLEERARAVLGYKKADEVIVFRN